MSRQDIPVSFAMRPSVSEEIDRLWTLRGLDEELVTLNAALRRFPDERAGIARQLAGERARLDQAKARVAELQKARRAVEQEISGLTETERKFQNQLMAVKKNEEYKALQHEIAGVKSKRSDLETRVLEHLEAEDGENAQRPLLERALQAAENEAAERVSRIDAEERADRERVAALETERGVQVAGLQQAVRSRYERIRSSLDGRALVAIVKGACGGCFRAQPPQVIQEARKRDRVLTCEGCGRLLLWPPEGA
jgi:predicted  nucleic acid-binding Zn-ribbon protein